MIYRDKIIAALESRRLDFESYDSEVTRQTREYREAMASAAQLGRERLSARLEGIEFPGARPTDEFSNSFVLGFGPRWNHHQEAREWAYQSLLGRTTFAVDGSQIVSSKDFSVPVAAVQIGWFENKHTPDGDYRKDVSFEVLSPAHLTPQTSAGDSPSTEQLVYRVRFQREIERIMEYMNQAAGGGIDPKKPPVVFFDGSLVVSFAATFSGELKQFYVGQMIALLQTSRDTRVALVGYIDTSFARDIATMLRTAMDLRETPRVHDATLLAQYMEWGDRTPLFQCLRKDLLQDYGAQWSGSIGFVYMKTAGPTPSRIELPLWIYEAGLLDYVLDVVRAEVVVGQGYPYAIETADSVAVLDTRDRDIFYATFQKFIENQNLTLRIARKAISKAHRR